MVVQIRYWYRILVRYLYWVSIWYQPTNKFQTILDPIWNLQYKHNVNTYRARYRIDITSAYIQGWIICIMSHYTSVIKWYVKLTVFNMQVVLASANSSSLPDDARRVVTRALELKWSRRWHLSRVSLTRLCTSGPLGACHNHCLHMQHSLEAWRAGSAVWRWQLHQGQRREAREQRQSRTYILASSWSSTNTTTTRHQIPVCSTLPCCECAI